jgi:hypothetical protein
MAAGRIRSIRPELREWEPFAGLTDAAARLFLLLPTIADDSGRCPASASYISGAIFFVRQRSANVIGQLLAEIEAANLIRRYTAKGGAFLEIVGWSDKEAPTYQYIKRSHPQRYPAPEWAGDLRVDRQQSTAETTPDLEQELDQRSGPGSGPGPGELKKLELEPLLRSLPPGPGGLRPPAGGAFVAAARVAIDAGELTIDKCLNVAADLVEAIASSRIAVNGERHYDNLLASWIRAAADRAAGRQATKKTAKRSDPKPKKQKQKQQQKRKLKTERQRAAPECSAPKPMPARMQSNPPTLPDDWTPPDEFWTTGDARRIGTFHQFRGREYIGPVELDHSPATMGMTVFAPPPTTEFGTVVFTHPPKSKAGAA